MRICCGVIAWIVISAALSGIAGAAQPVYRITDLGTLGGGVGGYTDARDMNDLGQVTGLSNSIQVAAAFLWDPAFGEMQALGTLGRLSTGYAINGAGQVTGSWLEPLGSNYLEHAFLWDPTTRQMRDLGTPPSGSWGGTINESGQVSGGDGRGGDIVGRGAFLWDPKTQKKRNITPLEFRGSGAYLLEQEVAMNDAGQVAGNLASVVDEYVYHVAFAWDDLTRQSQLLRDDTGWSFEQSAVQGINNSGQVVGHVKLDRDGNGSSCPYFGWSINPCLGFVWEPATHAVLELGTLGGGMSAATDINDAGQVTGVAATADGRLHAFLWDPITREMQDLGALGSNDYSKGHSINDSGQVTGESSAPFLWDGDELWNLNSLIDPADPLRPYVELRSGSEHQSINNRSQILTLGSDRRDAAHAVHYYVLAPVAPTPVIQFDDRSAPALVDLTVEGKTDWIHWGRTTATAVDRKARVPPNIGTVTAIGGVTAFASDSSSAGYSWTDGAPLPAGINNKKGLRIDATIGGGFQFTVPADTTLKTLRVYLGLNDARGRLTASLSDSSAPTLNTLITEAHVRRSHATTLSFRAGSPGQTLTVTFTLDAVYPGAFNWIMLESATLDSTVETAPVIQAKVNQAANSMVNLTTAGPIDWIHWGGTAPTGVDRKAGVTPTISTFTAIGGVTPFASDSSSTGYSWTDGTPVALVPDNSTGVRINPTLGGGFRFTVPADTTLKNLKVYVGLNNARGKLTATLSDGSAPAVNTLIKQASGRKSYRANLIFRARSQGQTLTVTFTLDAVYAGTYQWIMLESAALGNAP